MELGLCDDGRCEIIVRKTFFEVCEGNLRPQPRRRAFSDSTCCFARDCDASMFEDLYADASTCDYGSLADSVTIDDSDIEMPTREGSQVDSIESDGEYCFGRQQSCDVVPFCGKAMTYLSNAATPVRALASADCVLIAACHMPLLLQGMPTAGSGVYACSAGACGSAIAHTIASERDSWANDSGRDSVVNEGVQLPSHLTTVMLQNLPNNLSRAMFLTMLDERGFGAQYDFVYLPVDFARQSNLGYAFVNLVDVSAVERFWAAFDGFASWPGSSQKICRLKFSNPAQGRWVHIEKFRNSPIMHPDVPDECRPVLFEDGMRVEFPPPTKPLKQPRLRKQVMKKRALGQGQDRRQ